MSNPPIPPAEPVWTYRGYQLKASEFTAAMVHFYRGEMHRSNVWRQRLDNTTNWAVITAGASLSFAFSNPMNPHGVIPLNTLLITLFLFIEARRYRYYELFTSRIRLMETDFFASMLVPPFGPAADWAESLAENLLHPHFTISTWEAFGRRFRRNYMAIYLILAVAWLLKVWMHPVLAASFAEFIEHAAVGPIPGWVVLLAGLTVNGLIFATGLLTLGLQQASGEVLPRFDLSPGLGRLLVKFFSRDEGTEVRQTRKRAWWRPTARRAQLLTLIITDHGKEVSQAILARLKRGVTRVQGEGMYSGNPRDVLLVAITLTEVAHLKSIVHEADSAAFVVVSPAQDIFGKGFQALGADVTS